MVEHERTGLVDLVTWSFSRVAMWAPAFVVAIMLYEVVMRYIFVRPTLWVNEMSLWVAGGIYLTAGLYAMQQRSHIRIFILYDIVPRWLQRTFDVVSLVCILIFAFAVIWGGYGEAYAKLMRWETFGTAWDPPIPATMKPLVLITMVFLSLQAVSNLVYDWNRAPEHHDRTEDLEIDPEEVIAHQGLYSETQSNAPSPGKQ
jgi:TRAP-type C4-dicarboxylate transport system permease small subunit